MKLRSFLTPTLLALVLVALAAASVLALAPAGKAAAQPEPTMVITPSSGPCDATVEVTGQDFPPSTRITLVIAEPTTEGTLIELTLLVSDSHGGFHVTVSLGWFGCVAARLADELAPGSHELRIFAWGEPPAHPPGSAGPVLARAVYSYTTAQASRPNATLTVSPAIGPCDAEVEVSGSGFDPSSEMALRLGRPHSEGSMGILGAGGTDADGHFTIGFVFGDLGCEAAALDALADDPGEPKELFICGQTGGWSACTTYTYTTTAPTGSVAPGGLPRTGDGAEYPETGTFPLALLLGLTTGGILIIAVALAARRKLS